MVNSREINLNETLDELLFETDLTSVEIAEEIGVSPTSMTHYRQGKSNPRLDTLVDLAAVLDVSLDYLIFGESSEDTDVDMDPVFRETDQSLRKPQTQTSHYASLVSRVGQRLSEKVDEEVGKQLSENPSRHHFPGTLTREELLSIEKYSHTSQLLVRSLRYDTFEATSETPGTYFTTVANNLSQGREYQYLFPERSDTDWEPIVNQFRQSLVDQIGSERTVHNNCRFRITSHPIAADYGLYQLTIQDLREDNAILYDFLDQQGYINGQGRFGYVITPSSNVQGGVIMDEVHRSGASASFEKLWHEAESI